MEEVLFSNKECNEFISFHKWATKNLITNNNQSHQSKILYKGFQIPCNTKTSNLYNKLFSFFEKANNIELYEYPKEVYLLHYIVGDLFSPHTDEINERVYAVGVLLNDSFKGGDFLLYNKDSIKCINKIIGNCYSFDVSIRHEITEITEGERWAIIAFINKQCLTNKKEKSIL